MRRHGMRLIFLFFSAFLLSAHSVNASEKILNFRLKGIQSKIVTNFIAFNHLKSGIRIEKKNNKKYDFSKIINDSNNIAFLFFDGERLTHEKYNYTAVQTTPLFLYSITKSFTGMLLIHSLCEKDIVDLDVEMGNLSNRLKNTIYEDVTIRNALKMQSGIGRGFFKSHQISMFRSFLNRKKAPLDWLREVKRDGPQGKNFWYNANDTNALGVLIEDLTGESISSNFGRVFVENDKFNDDLFWQYSKDKENIGAYGLMASAQDIIRLGSSFLEILDNNKCVKNIYETMMLGDKSKGAYGFQIWIHSSQKEKSNQIFYGQGHGGQYLLMDGADKSVGFIYSIDRKYKVGSAVDEFYKQKYRQ